MIEKTSARKSGLRRWGRRLLWALLAAEIAWLLAMNLALGLPLTQDLLNRIQPDQFQLAWDRAWSLYPGQVTVRGARVSGQSPSQQWQANAERVSARVALWPLLFREVRIHRGRVTDGAYLQRPRQQPGTDDSEARPWFPDIEGYEPSEAVERVRRDRRPWTVTVRDAHLDGRHHFWLRRTQALFGASARVDLSVESPGGALYLQVRELDLPIDRAWVEADSEIVSDSRLSGTFSLGPYRTREHRGAAVLRFMGLDLQLDVHAEYLDFLNLFLLKYPDARVSGRGRIEGRVVLDDGRLKDDSHLAVDADDLEISQPPFISSGAGQVELSLRQDRGLPLQFDFLFDRFEVLHYDDRSRFFAGSGLRLGLGDSGYLLPLDVEEGELGQSLDRLQLLSEDQRSDGDFRLALDLPDARVEDMAVFNRYLPADSTMAFSGGAAALTAQLDLVPDDARGEFRLKGDGLAARIAEQEFAVDLTVNGRVDGGRPGILEFDLAGTELLLDQARVMGDEQDYEDDAWSTRLVFKEGAMTIEEPARVDMAAELSMSDTRPFVALFLNAGAPNWLARRAEMEEITGEARLAMRDGVIYVPEATVGDEKIGVGMKGVINGAVGDGVILMRYGKSHALLEFEDGRRHLVLVRPSAKYEAYEAPQPPPD